MDQNWSIKVIFPQIKAETVKGWELGLESWQRKSSWDGVFHLDTELPTITLIDLLIN